MCNSFKGLPTSNVDFAPAAKLDHHPARSHGNKTQRNRNMPKQTSNGISKKRSTPKNARLAQIPPEVQLNILDDLLFIPDGEMELLTAKESEADELKEKYRYYFNAFEYLRSERDLATFNDDEIVTKINKDLSSIRDDMELFDLDDPGEIRLNECWELWYLLECDEFLEGNAVTHAQKRLKTTVSGIVKLLQEAKRKQL